MKKDLEEARVSNSFWAKEWFVSSDHPEIAQEMVMPQHCLYKIKVMANTILQPARDWFGRIDITSGFRSMKLNELVGGSPKSQHLLGEAVDIVPMFVSPFTVAQWIKEQLPFAWWQLIVYLNKDGRPRFVHVSLPSQIRNIEKKALVKFGPTFHPWEEGVGYVVK